MIHREGERGDRFEHKYSSYILLVLLGGGGGWRQQCNSSGGWHVHPPPASWAENTIMTDVRKWPSPVYVLSSLWHDPTPPLKGEFIIIPCVWVWSRHRVHGFSALPAMHLPSPPHPPSLFPGKQGTGPK
jgi:hypothetical protein